tara:strand:- start:836 stop:1054 length:219 start_codon:yes stop_codon:yes gene_type:complete
VNLAWEQTRYVSVMIHNVQCEKKSQMLQPDELFQLPNDIARKKKRAEPKSTRKEMETFLAKYNSMTNKKTLK